jgi:drug/metabolite transporter (DMT)-like permease
VLGERIGWEVAVGGALVLAGVRVTSTPRPARVTPKAEQLGD